MQKWSNEDSNPLWLITKEEFDRLPTGIELECINGKKYVKGIDNIDDDTRYGHLAYGVRDPFNHKEKDLFLIFKLVQ